MPGSPTGSTTPLVRDDATGRLETVAWMDALRLAARSLAETRDRRGVGVLTGGRLSVEDAYAYAKFARVALRTNDIDFRARPHSAEETEFLSAVVAGTGLGVTYRELEAAPAVLLAGFEPEEESPIVFLRLRKAARDRGMRLFSAAPFATPSLTKALGTLLPTVPGGEAALLDALAVGAAAMRTDRSLLPRPRCAGPGRSSSSGSGWPRVRAPCRGRFGWRRRPGPGSPGCRAGPASGARLDAGAFPTLLPGGRAVADPGARADLSGAWGVEVPSAPGRDTDAILRAAARGELDALVVAGLDPADLPDPALAREALARVPLLVSLELRRSAVTEVADIVLPVASVMEKAGTFYDWEGRPRPFQQALDSPALPDLRVLDLIAAEMGAGLGLPDVFAARRELAAVGLHRGERPPAPTLTPPHLPAPGAGEAVLATWTWLLDAGRMQDGEPHLAGTAKRPRLHLSAATAAAVGVEEGDLVTVSSERGSLVLPLVLADMPDEVVWVPTNAPGYPVRERLAAGAGAIVGVSRAQVTEAAPAPDASTAGDSDSDSGSDFSGSDFSNGGCLMLSASYLADDPPNLASFGNEPFWLTLVKVVAVFIMLVVAVLLTVYHGHVLDHLAARVRDHAVGPHHGDADEQVARGAVAEPPRPGGAGGDPPPTVASAGASSASCWPAEAERRGKLPDRRAGLHPRQQVAGRVLEDLVHRAQVHHQIAAGRRSAPGEPRPGAARHHREAGPAAAARNSAAASAVDDGEATNEGTTPATASAAVPSASDGQAAASAGRTAGTEVRSVSM